jgi:hypothetical protein
MKREEFFRLLEEATEVRSDPRGWYLVRLPGEGWRLFHLATWPPSRPISWRRARRPWIGPGL